MKREQMFSFESAVAAQRRSSREDKLMHFAQFDANAVDRRHRIEGGLSRRMLLQGLAAGGLVAGLGGVLRVAPLAAAQEATPAAATRAAHRLKVGQIEVLILQDGGFPGPASLFAVNAPEAALAEAVAAEGLALDAIPVDIHPLLIETSGQRVLLDTGPADDPEPGKLLAALAAEGIAPEEIDVVLLTHMHSDHFGGALDANGALTFPNARYLINAVEQEFWAAGPSLDELVVPDEFKHSSARAPWTPSLPCKGRSNRSGRARRSRPA